MGSRYTAELTAKASQQPHQCSAKTLLGRVVRYRQSPCFIIAPQRCGQLKLLKAYLKQQTGPVCCSLYKVDEDGYCLPEENEEGSEFSALREFSEPPATSHAEHITIIPFTPWLDDEAAQHFSNELDAFIEKEERVFVLCPAQNDRYHNLQGDRVEITAQELKQSGIFSADAYALSVKQLMMEFLPLQVRLAAALTLVLGQTSLDELKRLGYEMPPDLPQLLADLHPLFSVMQSGKGIRAEYIDIQQIQHEFCQVITEHLESEGQIASISLVASRITALSIVLLERGDLEASHQVLSIAEGLISQGVYKTQPQFLHEEPLSEMPDFSDAFRAGTQIVQRDVESVVTAPGSVVQERTQSILSSTPTLYVRLFGKLEVYLEGVPLANSYLSRTKIRRLLAYLALNQQRVVSRDTLIEYLWPYLDFDRAQKNLYTSWCMLAKGLGSEKVRDCPYIQRNGEIYQLHAELVVCDTQEFEEIARTILFGRADMQTQLKSLLKMEALYHDLLIADISVDSFIAAKTEGYRSMMVDSLLLITRLLRNEGELERALFCARAAYELDESREDVYRELMDTQLEAGQRTSAMQTYFSCKRYLSDELGILPSKSTTALYQDLLLDNCS